MLHSVILTAIAQLQLKLENNTRENEHIHQHIQQFTHDVQFQRTELEKAQVCSREAGLSCHILGTIPGVSNRVTVIASGGSREDSQTSAEHATHNNEDKYNAKFRCNFAQFTRCGESHVASMSIHSSIA